MNLARRWTSPTSASVRWLLGVLPWIVVVAVALLLWDGRERHVQTELLLGSPIAWGTVVSVDHGQPRVSYTHGVVGDVVAEVDAGDAAVGDEIVIAYDVDDPYRVEQRDHHVRRDLAPWIIAGSIVVVAGSFAAMQWSARRQRSLAADESTAFSMLGAIHHSRLSVVPRLSLYALDSAAHDRPVCTIRLADIRVDGPGDVCFPVEVKGFPRPSGLVVPRVGDTVVWPRGRALVGARHRRPAQVAAPELREAGNVRKFLTWLAVCGVCGVLLTATVALVSTRGARITEKWIADGRRAVATIVSRNERSVNVDVVLDDSSRPAVLMAAPVDYPDDYDPGQKYPAVVRHDGGRVRLLAEPYDAVEPILWAAIPTGVLLWWATRRVIGA